LSAKARELITLCLYRSAVRVANERRRLARSEQLLIPYMRASFDVMNSAKDLLEPEIGRDTALELVSLLESSDRARSIQSDLPELEYESTAAWLTACSYDNLAKAIANLNGYNSDGVHACIA